MTESYCWVLATEMIDEFELKEAMKLLANAGRMRHPSEHEVREMFAHALVVHRATLDRWLVPSLADSDHRWAFCRYRPCLPLRISMKTAR
jgi:hypothetical protein